MAVELNIPLIMGAQFNRAGSLNRGKMPSLEDLRESGDLEQDAALVLGLHATSIEEAEADGKQEQRREVNLDIKILKYRGGQAGKKIGLRWDRPILKIKDPAGTAAAAEW
jgi:replicative DNA helicase